MSTKSDFIVYDYARARFMDKQWALRTMEMNKDDKCE
jgi:hypothetical protein